METTQHIWLDGAFVDWNDAKIHVVSHGLHYGSGVFEGIRSHLTHDGKIVIFRLTDHVARLFLSAQAISLKLPFTEKEIFEAIVETVRKNGARELYVRPIAFYGYGVMGVHAKNAPATVSVSCWPWAKYLVKEVLDVKISSVRRLSPRMFNPEGKICGHYVNSMRALQEIQGTDFDEVIMLDEDGFVAEGSAENIFIVKDGVLITPQRGTALHGITRRTVIQLAMENGISVEERAIKPEELFTADEAFFTGTAVKIVGIATIDSNPIGDVNRPLTNKFINLYRDVLQGRTAHAAQWLTYV